MPITKLTPTAFEDNVKFRNLIINGDMSIAQRGTSATGLGNGDSGYHTVDRWRFNEAGSPTFEFTMSQDSDVPTGQGFVKSTKLDCTTADTSLAAGDNLTFQTRFEGQNLQYLKKGTSSAESLTLSFWVKSSKTGTYICELYDNDNARQISKSYTIDTADTWEKKTITYAGDTTGTLDNDSNASLLVGWFLGAGSNFTSGTLNTSWNSSTNANRAVGQVNLADSTDNDWYITGVQLEAGEVATPFEFLPHDVNLQRCQRYCYSESAGDTYHAIMNGFFSSSTLYIGLLNLPTSMRAGPSLTTSGNFHIAGTTSYSASGFIVNDNNVKNVSTIQFRATVSGATGGQGANFRNDNDATATFILSSEL